MSIERDQQDAITCSKPTMCEICSKLTVKTPERRHSRRSSGFIVNFEHISHCSLVSIANFGQVKLERWP